MKGTQGSLPHITLAPGMITYSGDCKEPPPKGFPTFSLAADRDPPLPLRDPVKSSERNNEK